MRLETYIGRREWERMNVGGSDTSMNMPSLVSFDIWKHIDVLNIQKLNQQGWD